MSFAATNFVFRTTAIFVLPLFTLVYCAVAGGRVKPTHVDSFGMAQFGAGTELAAQCPIAPTPDGWREWAPDGDGPIPDALTARAQVVANDETVLLGTTESYPLPGVVALIRVEPRIWGRDAQGNLVQGCFRSSVIYLPDGTATSNTTTPPASTGSLEKTVGALTAVSLVVGTVATLATWGRK